MCTRFSREEMKRIDRAESVSRGILTVMAIAAIVIVFVTLTGCGGGGGGAGVIGNAKADTPSSTPVVVDSSITPAAVKLARATVRKLAFPGATTDSNCSAVVMREGVAVTAAHCILGQTATVSGLAVTSISTTVGDAAEVQVPGLACPCAEALPGVTEQDRPVVAIGFPYNLIQVATFGTLQGAIDYSGTTLLLATAPIAPGDSGGGLFVVQNGRPYLVGILSATTTVGGLSFAVLAP